MGGGQPVASRRRMSKRAALKNIFSVKAVKCRLSWDPTYPMNLIKLKSHCTVMKSLRNLSCRLLPALMLVALPLWSSAADSTKRVFNIPAGPAINTLRTAAQQAEKEIAVPADLVQNVDTQAVKGQFAVTEALTIMLANTNLVAHVDEKTGALTLKTKVTPRERPRAPSREKSSTLEPSSEEPLNLSPFVVTGSAASGYRATNSISGTKTNTQVLDLPMTLQIITEDFIRDVGMFDSQEVLNYSANARTSGRTEVIIRGFSSTLQLRDGFRRYDSIDTSMISRVEVISGPASVLYGQAAPGGIVNYVSKVPLDQNQFQATERFGWNNYLRTTLDANWTVNENLAARGIFSFQHKETDLRFDTEEISVINPTIQYKPFRKTTVTLSLEHSDYERGANRHPAGLLDNGISIVLRYGTPTNANFYGQDAKSINTVDVALLTIDQAIGEHVSVRLGINVAERDNPLNHPDGIGIVTNPLNGQREVRFYWRNRTDNITSQNVIFDTVTKFETGGVKHQVLAGYSFLFNNQRILQLEDLLPNNSRNFLFYSPTYNVGLIRRPSNVNYVYIPGSSSRTLSSVNSFYATHQGKYFDEKLISLVGLYHTIIDNRTRTDSQVGRARFKGKHTGPQIGFLYRPVPWASTFAVTSSSLLPTTPGQIDGFDQPFDPETGKSYEAGFNLQTTDQRYSGTLAFYDVRQQNRVVFDPEAPNKNNPTADPNFARGANVQFGEIQSRGFDLDLFANPRPDLQVILGYAYLDQMITRDGVDINVGRNVTGRSNNKFRTWVLYEFQRSFLKGLAIGAGYRWSSQPLARYNAAGQPEYNEDISNGDAMIRYRGTFQKFSYTLSANMRNINRQCRVDGVDFSGQRYKTRFPREWYVSADVKI